LIESYVVDRFCLLAEAIVPCGASEEGAVISSFETVLDELASGAKSNADQILRPVRDDLKAKTLSRIKLRIEAEKRLYRAKATDSRLEKVDSSKVPAPNGSDASEGKTARKHRKRGRRRDDAIQRRRKIVSGIAQKPSDLDDPKIVAVVFRDLDLADVPLPYRRNAGERLGTYAALKGSVRGKVIQVLKKDLQRN
jgi:hypothetical protein